jgi:hypothetical protein
MMVATAYAAPSANIAGRETELLDLIYDEEPDD